MDLLIEDSNLIQNIIDEIYLEQLLKTHNKPQISRLIIDFYSGMNLKYITDEQLLELTTVLDFLL